MTHGTVLSVLTGALAGYLAGSIPFGLILGRWLRGVDIRQHGSKNLGATNAYRVLGRRIGVAVFALDFAKGLAPALVAARSSESAALAAGVAAVLGHVFPIWLGFRGGKGVATAAGVLTALAPLPTAVAAAVFALTVAATRYVSLGSILAALALPTAQLALHGRAAVGSALPVTLISCALALLVLVRHRSNIRRLLDGTESRFGAPAPAPPADADRSGPTSHVGP